mmetsp:Transcript_34334/g.25412  ORF Transcript_34334/g.25412 Transcript_34334/m.25412 type:complete len:138 (-) Transcript_34334:504-917(-)
MTLDATALIHQNAWLELVFQIFVVQTAQEVLDYTSMMTHAFAQLTPTVSQDSVTWMPTTLVSQHAMNRKFTESTQITASALQMQNVNQETVHPPMFVPQTAQALLTQTTANVLTILNANPHSALPTSANQSAVKSTL